MTRPPTWTTVNVACPKWWKAIRSRPRTWRPRGTTPARPRATPRRPWSRNWRIGRSAAPPPTPRSSAPSSTVGMCSRRARPWCRPSWPLPWCNCWSATSRTSSTTSSPPGWRKCSTRSRGVTPRACRGCVVSTSEDKPPRESRRSDSRSWWGTTWPTSTPRRSAPCHCPVPTSCSVWGVTAPTWTATVRGSTSRRTWPPTNSPRKRPKSCSPSPAVTVNWAPTRGPGGPSWPSPAGSAPTSPR